MFEKLIIVNFILFGIVFLSSCKPFSQDKIELQDNNLQSFEHNEKDSMKAKLVIEEFVEALVKNSSKSIVDKIEEVLPKFEAKTLHLTLTPTRVQKEGEHTLKSLYNSPLKTAAYLIATQFSDFDK